MRPYKKRVAVSQAQIHNENGMETDNSEDSDTQSSPAQKDKNDGKGGKKKWKRKISRKQFRHHDIKLFTPGEYRSSPLLKQKDAAVTSPKTPENNKESITDAIVTSLGGISTQLRTLNKEGSTEENNNTNGLQNHNNAVGKHQLPAIIMETPVVRRKSLDIINAPKLSVFGNCKKTPQNEHTSSSRLQDSCDANKPLTTQPGPMMTMTCGGNATARWFPNQKQQDSHIPENGHRPSLETPQNLSLKRRYSVEVPVDLRKKPLNASRDTERKSAPVPSSSSANKSDGELTHEALLLAAMRGEISSLDKELSALLKSQKTLSDTTHHHKRILRELEVNCLIKTALLVSKVKELKVLQKQTFNLDVLDNWLQAHKDLDAALKDDSILVNIRKEAQNILVEVYNDMFSKAEQLFGSKFNVEDFCKLLGRPEYRETTRLPPNLDELHRLRNLNLNDHTPIESMLKEPPNYHQSVYGASPNIYPHQDFNSISLRANAEALYSAYQTQNMKLPARLEAKERLLSSFMALQPRDVNFISNVDTDHVRAKKNSTKPRSKSNRSLEVQNGVQNANLKRSLSNPHNSNLDYSFMFHPPPHVAARMAPQYKPQEPVFYPPTMKTIPGYNYIQSMIPKKDDKQCQNSYPPESYANRLLEPPVPDGRFEPQQLSPPMDLPVPNAPVQNILSSPKPPVIIEPPKITSSTISNESHVENNVIVKPNLISLKESPKKMPEVIIADGSMQITKEPKLPSDIAKLPHSEVTRMTVITTSSKAVSSAATPTFSKSVEDETNPEFMDWLEKLKNNEKLKTKFLSQMGISKSAMLSDYIEISDSDEEVKVKKEKITEFETPASPIPQPMEIEEPPVKTHLKLSLSKTNYVPTITLPTNHPPRTSSGQEKSIYSPEIEPISPVNEKVGNFHFPPSAPNKVIPPNMPPLIPGIIDREEVLRERVVSPPYSAKRKTPQDFPEDYAGKVNRKSVEYPTDNASKRRKSLDRPKNSVSPRVAPSGKLCYIRENRMFLRYFDDTQMEMFISNLSSQDEELLRTTGIDPEKIKSTRRSTNFQIDHLGKTEIVQLPPDVEFSAKEDLPDVEEFVKESKLVEQFVPKDFADFYRYVTGFQIIKNKHPVSLKTFLTMYNTNRTTDLLRKYLQRLDENSTGVIVR